MNLSALKKALQPKLYETVIDGITVYIHRPTIKDANKCTSIEAVLVYCVKDENGKSIFTFEDEEELINVNEIDQVVANEIYIKVLGLITVEDEAESIEKK
ncbi:TPA: hypothetical protein ACNH5O_001294 [Citrobacter koseri]|nr:hypothetical protein [Citrobacter koseri]HEI9001018.1 hypothetical protein [Citrobacter koseri]